MRAAEIIAAECDIRAIHRKTVFANQIKERFVGKRGKAGECRNGIRMLAFHFQRFHAIERRFALFDPD